VFNRMLVSVVIPTYNSSLYLADALESVVGQTYKEFEIIVVDDGSTDDTEEVVRGFPFPIIYLKVSNGGPAKARNIGMINSQGEFVSFLDADDLWLPRKLEKQIKAFEADPALMMVFTEDLFLQKDKSFKKPFSKKKRLMRGDVVKNIFLFSYVGTPTVMIRRSIFKEVGYFEENMLIAEDDNLWLRIASKYKISLLDEVLVHIRLTDGSLSRTKGNIFSGVQEHIALIHKKYPELEKRLGSTVIRRKKSDLYFSQGYSFFVQHQHRLARDNFVRSFILFPNIKQPLFFLCSFLPLMIIERIRRIKQNFPRF
jgi:glycosyltransferase involved in cell wall biosynthesis